MTTESDPAFEEISETYRNAAFAVSEASDVFWKMHTTNLVLREYNQALQKENAELKKRLALDTKSHSSVT